jgi:hypothetical protein
MSEIIYRFLLISLQTGLNFTEVKTQDDERLLVVPSSCLIAGTFKFTLGEAEGTAFKQIFATCHNNETRFKLRTHRIEDNNIFISIPNVSEARESV